MSDKKSVPIPFWIVNLWFWPKTDPWDATAKEREKKYFKVEHCNLTIFFQKTLLVIWLAIYLGA